MNLNTKRNLDDVAQLCLAAWMVVSPFALGYSPNVTATLTVVAIGTFLSLTTQLSIARPGYWEESVSFALAVFLVASPFLLGFSELASATINTISSGVVLGILAMVGLVQQRRLERETTAIQPQQSRPAY